MTTNADRERRKEEALDRSAVIVAAALARVRAERDAEKKQDAEKKRDAG